MSALTNGERSNGSGAAMKEKSRGVDYDDFPVMTGSVGMGTTDRLQLLRRTIESEIIPRLLMSCRAETLGDGAVAMPGITIDSGDVQKFTDLVLDGTAAALSIFIEHLLEIGASKSQILLDLLAPTARRLGELWESDERNFAEVTVAMGQLQHALRLVGSDSFDQASADHASRRTILLAPCDDEQHSFAVQVLDAFFMRAGWDVEARLTFSHKDIGSLLKKRSFDVLGLSVSRESLLDKLASDIEGFRRKSSNRSLVILVGGRVFIGQPQLVGQVGACGTAEDARAAVQLADRLVAERAVARS